MRSPPRRRSSKEFLEAKPAAVHQRDRPRKADHPPGQCTDSDAGYCFDCRNGPGTSLPQLHTKPAAPSMTLQLQKWLVNGAAQSAGIPTALQSYPQATAASAATSRIQSMTLGSHHTAVESYVASKFWNMVVPPLLCARDVLLDSWTVALLTSAGKPHKYTISS